MTVTSAATHRRLRTLVNLVPPDRGSAVGHLAAGQPADHVVQPVRQRLLPVRGPGPQRRPLLAHLFEARLGRAPELRRRIRWTRFGQGRPAVVEDHRFMVARHVTAVHLDGCDEEGFWTWCANQAIEPMDRDHPLWRVTFATGLASGRVGVLVVMHHALADGIAGAALAARLLDPAPDTVVAGRGCAGPACRPPCRSRHWWPASPSPWPRCPTPASSSSRSRSTAPSTTWRSSRPASPKGSTS
jgi:hypothetical protein